MSPRGPGGSPSDLVPGDPGGVEALAGRLRAYAEGAAAGAARLRAIDSGAWEGEAADAFRAVIDEIPSKLERGAGAFAEAADALGAYAATLRSAQEVATRVVGLLGEAD
ncbi:MAG: WXG100 family type VII secretion target, partial [Actinomycetota bacterium]|nr:WXG100 family type VII secretion target [Actinomycetota bacterium]